MSKTDLNLTYEKMYTYEEEIKNSIGIKTQLLFTATFILTSTTVYLARFLDFSTEPVIAYTITLLVCLVIIITAIAIYFNCRAFAGSEYNRLPYAHEIEKYYEQQVEYNTQLADYNAAVNLDDRIPLVDPKQVTENFITKTYIDCATHNALINEDRSRSVFKAFAAFLLACFPLAIASLLFVVFDMDTSSPRKDLSIKDTHVSSEIAALRNQLATSSKIDDVADLKKRTTILEHSIAELKEKQLSDSKKSSNTEQQPKPQPPAKPSAPPSRMTYDDVKGDPNRNPR